MRTLNAKDKVLKRTKRLKKFIAYISDFESIEDYAFTMEEARAKYPHAKEIVWNLITRKTSLII